MGQGVAVLVTGQGRYLVDFAATTLASLLAPPATFDGFFSLDAASLRCLARLELPFVVWAAEADVQGLAAPLGLQSVPEADYRVLYQFVRLKHAWPARVQVENQA